MNKEFTRMQQLAGIITESYVAHSEVSETSTMDKEPTMAAMMGPEKGKMTRSEFKKKLKEAILAERALSEDFDLDSSNLGGDNAATMAAYADMDNLDETSYEGMERMDGLAPITAVKMLVDAAQRIIYSLKKEGFEDEDIHSYLSDLITTLPTDLSEAKKKEDEEEDIDIESDVEGDVDNLDLDLDTAEEEGGEQVDMNMDSAGDIDAGSSESKKAFSELTDAYRAAKELGDEKLIRQIANTITYFNKNIILSQG
jgi:hypothetical protein